MEHIIVTHLDDDYVLLTPEKGYALVNIITSRKYSEAEVKEEEMKNFKAEAID